MCHEFAAARDAAGWDVRAGRLLNLLLLLQGGRRWTAAELAGRLQVSERTVLRDVEALSGAGIPVFGVRGPGGGFELLDTFEHAVPQVPPALVPAAGRLRRVRVRIAPAALQLALVTGRPEGWRPRPGAEPLADRPDWIEGSFRFDSYEAAMRQLMVIGPEVEVILPAELRAHLAGVGRRIAALHGWDAGPDDGHLSRT
jgi:predicted DNA-binding transcriptional regulator YafY